MYVYVYVYMYMYMYMYMHMSMCICRTYMSVYMYVYVYVYMYMYMYMYISISICIYVWNCAMHVCICADTVYKDTHACITIAFRMLKSPHHSVHDVLPLPSTCSNFCCSGLGPRRLDRYKK